MLEGLIAAIERQYGQLSPLPPPKLCNWCADRGCIVCLAAREKRDREWKAAQEAAFAAGPIFTARTDNPEEMAELAEVFHADVILKVFEETGTVAPVIAAAKNKMAARRTK